MSPGGGTLWTVGHATRTAQQLIALVSTHTVERLIDVRTLPRSRHNPQFNKETIEESLAAAGIGYEHQRVLGGLRKPRANSINLGWREPGFRGFADHMQSEEFNAAIDDLATRASTERMAILCAEAEPWRCHRSLIADALTTRGIDVLHIVDSARLDTHGMTPFARVRGQGITYPGLLGGEQT